MQINNPNMRPGWTLIELILMIVIIGVLASFALPKLMATRDDAILSKDISNMAICIQDAGSAYTAKGIDFTEEENSLACESVICYNITYAVGGKDFNVSINPNAADFCKNVEYLGGHLAESYDFGGSSLSL